MAVAEVLDLYTRVHDRADISMNEVFLTKLRNLTPEEGRELLKICSTAPETPGLMVLTGIYCQGGHVSLRDEKKALEMYRRAGDLGDSYAMNNLAYCFQNGIGVARDDQKAFKLYGEAVTRGNPGAVNNLGYCYQYGLGVQRDVTKAVELYGRGADLGDTNAMNGLGYCYENAIGVARDVMRAVELYGRAIALGNQASMNNLGLCYKNGVGVARDEEKAVELFVRAGIAPSLWNLGLYYKEKDPRNAIMYFCRAHSLYGAEGDKTDCRNAIDELLRDRGLQIAVLETILGHEKKIDSLEAEDRASKETIERLRAEVDFRPGGAGYLVARDDFMAKCPRRRRASI